MHVQVMRATALASIDEGNIKQEPQSSWSGTSRAERRVGLAEQIEASAQAAPHNAWMGAATDEEAPTQSKLARARRGRSSCRRWCSAAGSDGVGRKRPSLRSGGLRRRGTVVTARWCER